MARRTIKMKSADKWADSVLDEVFAIDGTAIDMRDRPAMREAIKRELTEAYAGGMLVAADCVDELAPASPKFIADQIRKIAHGRKWAR